MYGVCSSSTNRSCASSDGDKHYTLAMIYLNFLNKKLVLEVFHFFAMLITELFNSNSSFAQRAK